MIMEFLGFHRPDGQVGVRNFVLVIPGGMVAARICDFVDNWMSITSIFTGYAAAGAQINIFQHGGGGQRINNLILEPTPAVITPTLWTSANRNTLAHCGFSLDFYSGQVIEGEQTVVQAGEELLKLVIRTASGMMAKSETIKWEGPTHIYTLDTPF